MSRQTALENISLRPSTRWAHTEYSLEYSPAYVSRRTGLESTIPDFWPRAYDALSFDFQWSTNDGLIAWPEAGRVTDMGHAIYAQDGSDQRTPLPCPFASEDEVWAFDAVAEYGLPDLERQTKAYEESIQSARLRCPGQLTTGGYYNTIVSGAIAAFGWDLLLLAAADTVRLERVLDSFFRRTLFHMQAWARTSVEVVIQHDDFVWTAGGFMHPDVYRKIIIPRYAELWKPIHAAGKKVLFCSDGNFREYAADVAAAGADGFIFEPCNDFEWMAERFGQSHCLVGSAVDCRDLTLSNWEQARTAMDRTFRLLSKCRGAILTVGNHLPANIPEDVLDRYFDRLLPLLQK